MSLTQNKLIDTISELKQWMSNPSSKDDYTIYGKDKIEEKLKEDFLPKSTLNGFESLSRWYTNHFVYEMLTNYESTFRLDMTSNGYSILVLANKLEEKYPKNPPYLLFDKAAFWLANSFILDWKERSEELIKIINKNLFTGVLKGGLDFKPSSWFIIDIINQVYEITIQKSELNYPENMEVYQNAIDNWKTDDLNFIDSIVTSLCNFHLENATFGEDQENTADIQFGNLAWFVYAFEILTLLKAREIKGIPNPEKFSHPLMQLSINKLPENQISVINEDLFNKVLQKLND
ncbi:hypothetical protein [Chryseobacterium sp.]|uniref:hypothetical protein n=1 Tax=Chryseobacterium sp. TaxID=1871047 RepID=UPI00289F3508|nr:hypothetical protein [Chryseobacterium sp.]